MGNEIVPVPIGDDEIHAIQDDEGKWWVIIKRTCESFGLSFERQFRKLKEADWEPGVALKAIPDLRGSPQDTCVMPWESVPMWMTTIASGRVKPEFRERLRLFKREAKHVLAQRFSGQSSLQWEIGPKTSSEQLLLTVDCMRETLVKQVEQEKKVRQIEVRQDDQELVIREQQTELARIKGEREREEARLADLEEKVREQLDRIARVQVEAERAVRTVNTESGWYCLVPWAETQGIYLPPGNAPGHDAYEGKILTAMCRAEGIEIRKYDSPRFPLDNSRRKGGVNMYPLHMLRRWMVDYVKRYPICVNGR